MTPQTDGIGLQGTTRQTPDAGFERMLAGREAPEQYSRRMYSQGVARLHEISSQLNAINAKPLSGDDVERYNALLRKYEHTERSEVIPYAREAGIEYTPSFNSSMYMTAPKTESMPQPVAMQSPATQPEDDSLKAFSTDRLVNMHRKLELELNRRGIDPKTIEAAVKIVSNRPISNASIQSDVKNTTSETKVKKPPTIKARKTTISYWRDNAARLLGAKHWSDSWVAPQGADNALTRGVTDSMTSEQRERMLQANRHRIMLGRLVILGDKPEEPKAAISNNSHKISKTSKKTQKTAKIHKAAKAAKTVRKQTTKADKIKKIKRIKKTKSEKTTHSKQSVAKVLKNNELHRSPKISNGIGEAI